MSFFSFKPHLTISFWAIFWSMTCQTTNVFTGVAKCLARLFALLGSLSAATIMTFFLALMPLTWQWLSTHTITCYRAFTITWNCVFLNKKSSFWVRNHDNFVYLMSTNTHFLHWSSAWRTCIFVVTCMGHCESKAVVFSVNMVPNKNNTFMVTSMCSCAGFLACW